MGIGVFRGAEFDARVDGLSKKEKDKMHKEMRDHFKKAFSATSGPVQGRISDAISSLCEAYDLLYYTGSGRTVSREKPGE